MQSIFAQSQALNGQIESTILDQTGAAVPNAVIIVTIVDVLTTLKAFFPECARRVRVFHFASSEV